MQAGNGITRVNKVRAGQKIATYYLWFNYQLVAQSRDRADLVTLALTKYHLKVR